MNDIPAIGNTTTEEEYIAMCREAYRKKQDDTSFLARNKIRQMAKKLHPSDKRLETQTKSAISHLLRSRFKLERLDYVSCRNKDEVMAFLNKLEKLLEVKA